MVARKTYAQVRRVFLRTGGSPHQLQLGGIFTKDIIRLLRKCRQTKVYVVPAPCIVCLPQKGKNNWHAVVVVNRNGKVLDPDARIRNKSR